ncbi:hypothetical protein K439DRAFT_813749 [Ramaria rubella]|nr:hypothetical protein K439DRAFT_813749 [Ramaria rubella]
MMSNQFKYKKLHLLPSYTLFFWGLHTRMTSHQQICFDNIEGLHCENSSSGASLFTHRTTPTQTVLQALQCN